VYLRTDVTDPVYLRTDVTDPVYLRTDVTDPVYLRTDEIRRYFVVDEYNVQFMLTVTGPNDYSETFIINNGETLTIADLKPGEYTIVLSGDDIGALSKTVTVVVDETASVQFDYVLRGSIEYAQLEDLTLALRELEDLTLAPRVLDPEYLGCGNPQSCGYCDQCQAVIV
jgi:hypothetical protein